MVDWQTKKKTIIFVGKQNPQMELQGMNKFNHVNIFNKRLTFKTGEKFIWKFNFFFFNFLNLFVFSYKIMDIVYEI